MKSNFLLIYFSSLFPKNIHLGNLIAAFRIALTLISIPYTFHCGKALAKTSVNIVWVQNGKDALDYCINTNLVDLVLMDIKMPVMDGYDATRKIKLF